jgi:hypothetical protein
MCRVSDPDPYPDPHGSALFELLDPDLDPHTNCESGSGSRRAKITQKIEKRTEFSSFEVLDVLF